MILIINIILLFFAKVQIRKVVENQSYHTLPHPQEEEEAPFGCFGNQPSSCWTSKRSK